MVDTFFWFFYVWPISKRILVDFDGSNGSTNFSVTDYKSGDRIDNKSVLKQISSVL